MRSVLLCCIAAILLSGIAFAEDSRIRAFKAGDTHSGSVIVKTLDDRANPYKDQYTDFDRWVFAHANRHITLENYSNWQMGLDQAQGARYLFDNRPDLPRWDPEHGLWMVLAFVDEQGFMRPQNWRDPAWDGHAPALTVRESLTNMNQRWAPEPAGFWALGQLPREIRQAQAALVDDREANWNPPVAEWMVAQNKDAVLLPDGGAIFISDAALVPNGLNGKWLLERYAADGTLVKQTFTSSRLSWEDVLTDKGYDRSSPYFKRCEHQQPSGEVYTSNNLHGMGRYKLYRGERGSDTPVLALIDVWEDRFYSVEQDGPDFIDKLTIDWRYWRVIDSTELARIYLAQQALKQPMAE